VDYHECEHFKLMKQFLDNPDRMLKYLFNEWISKFMYKKRAMAKNHYPLFL
jgi:hypothetical protein